jgi:hypothetical protein
MTILSFPPEDFTKPLFYCSRERTDKNYVEKSVSGVIYAESLEDRRRSIGSKCNRYHRDRNSKIPKANVSISSGDWSKNPGSAIKHGLTNFSQFCDR